MYKRRHRGKYLYRRTVFRHVRNFGGSPMASYFRYEMGYVALPGEVEIKESGDVRWRAVYVRPSASACVYVYAKFIREMKDLRSPECNWMNDVQAGIPCALQLLTVVQYTSLDDMHVHTCSPRAAAYYFGTVHIISLRVQRGERRHSNLTFLYFCILNKNREIVERNRGSCGK